VADSAQGKERSTFLYHRTPGDTKTTPESKELRDYSRAVSEREPLICGNLGAPYKREPVREFCRHGRAKMSATARSDDGEGVVVMVRRWQIDAAVVSTVLLPLTHCADPS
jgi:hypothetical protein